ncbi:hypothetical protein G9A89_014241 [Geosiphon pyriformis]|nr:hypothetical protein G9A89_014241 [Geosiphon pyriformis]
MNGETPNSRQTRSRQRANDLGPQIPIQIPPQAMQPTEWIPDVRDKFEALGKSCYEVAIALGKFKDAIDNIQGGNLFNLENAFLSLPFSMPPPVQISNHTIPLAPPPPAPPVVTPQPFANFSTPRSRHARSTPSSIASSRNSSPTPYAYTPSRPNAIVHGLHGQEWSDDSRRKLNDRFIKYFKRREEGEEITNKIVSEELLGFAKATPSVKHLDRQVGRYLRRHTIPVDPVVLEAIESWIENEKVVRGKF